MRITIWLSIATFVTTLYWPQLLSKSGILSCALVSLVFLCWPKWRYLSIIPLTAIYFSIYIYITLLGGIGELISFTDNNVKQQTSAGFISHALNDQDNNLTVKIKSLINTDNTGYFIGKIVSINNQYCDVCPLIEMRWFRPSLQVQSGQVHKFKVRIKPLQGKANPDGFDRQKWRYSQHVAFVANIRQHLNVIDSDISLRAQFYEKTLHLTDHLSQKGSLIALIFADKSVMSNDVKTLIKQLGIAHLFAISGLHIGLLFVFSLFVLNCLIKSFFPITLLNWFSWRFVNTLSFFVCLGYGYISGFSLPTQRALLMLLVTILMLSSKRKVSLFDLLIICFWLILLMDPAAILSSSLWLSFVAMSIILCFVWGVQSNSTDHFQTMIWWRRAIRQIFLFVKWLVILQLALTLFMLPIQLLNFSAISLYSILINLIAIPLFSWLIIPLTLMGSLLIILTEPVGVLLLSFSNDLLVLFFDYMQGLSTGYFLLSNMMTSLILSVVLFMLLVLFLLQLKRFVIVHELAIIAVILFFFCFIGIRTIEMMWQDKGTWQVEVFDVGQGLAVLIKSNGEYLLYDTGASYGTHYATASTTILPYLNAHGIEQLDYMFISHSDNDHSGGQYVINHQVLIKNAYAGEASLLNKLQQQPPDINYQQCLAGQVFTVGNLSVSVLSPSEVGTNNNDNSCVLNISDGLTNVLLTGDISKTIEKRLVDLSMKNHKGMIKKQSRALKADILIAPHHGSKTSSSIDFIKLVDPGWVVFSAGYKNRWNFPILSVVDRYKSLGIKQLTTSKSGFIRFNVENQHIDVKTYREDLAAYWYHHHLAF